MKRIALLHTVQAVADTFGAYLSEVLPSDTKLYNLWDQFLSLGPNDEGCFTREHKKRLYRDLISCEELGVNVVVVTCSTLTPHLSYVRPFLTVPIIAIDEPMLRKAAKSGGEVLLVATAGSAIEPAHDRLLEEARGLGRTVSVTCHTENAAYKKMQKNDMEAHNQILVHAVGDLAREKSYTTIVLCQASMAPCADAIERETGVRTLSSPPLCREQVKEMLSGK